MSALVILGTYILVAQSSATCHRIKSVEECEAAAQQLGLSDTTVYSDVHNPTGDPPYCFVEQGRLKFNEDGTNAGACGTGADRGSDKCLCISPDTW